MTRPNGRMVTLGWSDRLGRTSTLAAVEVCGRPGVRIQEEAVEALTALSDTLKASGYEDPCDWIGSYNKRPIAGLGVWSTHAYGLSIDLDYGGGNDSEHIDRNPHLHRRIVPGDRGFGVEFQLLESQVRSVEAIRTGNGAAPWRWLGWSIGDTMHFQIDCSPYDLSTGVTMPGQATHFQIGGEYPEYEEITWILYRLQGGRKNINGTSGQIEPVLGKSNVRKVTIDDFNAVAKHTNMNETSRQKLIDQGLYRWGMELDELRFLDSVGAAQYSR